MTQAVDWDWLVERAGTHRVAALVAGRLRRCRVPGVPPDSIAARLEEIGEQAAQRAAASQETLRQLADGLNAADVPFLLLKGSVLAELIYQDPSIRPFYDVDIVVRRESLATAEALMGAWNYHMAGVGTLLGSRGSTPEARKRAEAIARSTYLRMFHNLSYAPSRGDARRPIELHWNIVPRGRLRLREAELWERTMAVTVAGITVRTLDPDATLIHLAVHALEAWFHGFKLLHLYDVAWTATRWQDRFRGLWRLADEWGAAYHLELALRLSDRLSDVPAARALLEGRRATPWMRTALRVALTDRILVDRNVARSDTWRRRAAVELGWGLAVRGLQTKLRFSLARRLAAARWRYGG